VLLALLVDLREIGVSFVIDDFGTGYSSLSYLKNIPIPTIKIDRSFVKDIEDSRKDYEIIKSIVSMAQGLGMLLQRFHSRAFDLVKALQCPTPIGCIFMLEN
jgi:EAL domain-containing protein (putative c-di-GMP-specific phosphodiesterase class I)